MKNVFLSILCIATVMLFSSCTKESSEKQITSFSITNISDIANGTINQTDLSILVNVPEGTDVTNLIPSIVISKNAVVSPASGVSQNFINPVTYVVTAEDGTTASYVVTVSIGENGGSGSGQAQTLDGSMDVNTTLPDLGLPIDYIIDGSLNIDSNALLTIEAGVTIAFTGSDGNIVVGENAGIKMIGTADNPIVLQGPINNQNNGSWECITINSQRADNEMKYVKFIKGGSYNDTNYGVVRNYGKLKMTYCTIDGSLGCGLEIWNDGTFTNFSNNIIKNCDIYPVTASELSKYKNFGQNEYLSNNKNFLKINGNSYNGNEDMLISKQTIPYYFEDGFSITENTLTIEAGISILMGTGTSFEIADNARLIADGTNDNNIVFNGLENETGYWGGIMISTSNINGALLNYCVIKNGGNSSSWTDNHNIYLRSSSKSTIKNTVISDSYFYGIVIENSENEDFSFTHENITFSNNRMGNIYYENSETSADDF